MKYTINTECIACGRCFRNCPRDAIAPAGDQYQIDPEKCVGCGKCASLCPISAISEQQTEGA